MYLVERFTSCPTENSISGNFGDNGRYDSKFYKLSHPVTLAQVLYLMSLSQLPCQIWLKDWISKIIRKVRQLCWYSNRLFQITQTPGLNSRVGFFGISKSRSPGLRDFWSSPKEKNPDPESPGSGFGIGDPEKNPIPNPTLVLSKVSSLRKDSDRKLHYYFEFFLISFKHFSGSKKSKMIQVSFLAKKLFQFKIRGCVFQ